MRSPEVSGREATVEAYYETVQKRRSPGALVTTFLRFLKKLVHRRRRKIFLIIDNSPCHRLNDEAKAWLRANRHRIELWQPGPIKG